MRNAESEDTSPPLAQCLLILALAAPPLVLAACGGGDDACGGDDAARAETEPLPPEPELSPGLVEVFHEVAQGETFGVITEDHGIPYSDMLTMVEVGEEIQDLTRIRAGRVLQLRFDPATDALVDLAYPVDDDAWMVLHRDPGGPFTAITEAVPYDAGLTGVAVTIDSSLWAACIEAGFRPADITGMAEIFEYDIDFGTDVRQGDQLAAWIETLSLDGRFVKYGHVLAARYVNAGTAHDALVFTTTDGKPGYYTPEGMSTKKMFLRSPLKFTRIASGFNRSRFHPILHETRPHWGTDYAAPSGTPIRALGDGRVTFAGWKGGYGKLVIIQHNGKYSTRYGHCSKFSKGIKAGTNVEQGQIIAYVGSTGMSTGPHLHFEFRIHGNPVDFEKQDFPNTEPVTEADMPRFEQERDALVAHLDELLLVAPAEAPAQPE